MIDQFNKNVSIPREMAQSKSHIGISPSGPKIGLWDQSQCSVQSVIGIDPPFTLLDAPWAIMAQMSEQLQPLSLLPRENRIFIDLSGLCSL